MSRKNIFEILLENYNVEKEIDIIWDLFLNAKVFDNNIESVRDNGVRTIASCVKKYSFANWKSRIRSISPLEMMTRLNINEDRIKNIKNFCDDLLNVLEFILNILERCDLAIEDGNVYASNEYNILTKNISDIIEHFGYEITYDEDEEKVLIYEKNSAATAVAEISTPENAKKIIQYNHHTLKGDIEKKKEIIVFLGSELEPNREKLNKINQSFTSDVFFLLNTLNLRHNNIDPKNKGYYKVFIAKMPLDDLENWYDEIYQMILLAMLLLDNVERQDKVNLLKKNCSESE